MTMKINFKLFLDLRRSNTVLRHFGILMEVPEAEARRGEARQNSGEAKRGEVDFSNMSTKRGEAR